MEKFNLLYLLIIPAVAFLGRVGGASWGPRQVGEVGAAAFTAYASWVLWGDLLPYYLIPVLALATTYFGIQVGHGNVYNMGTSPDLPDSPRGLDRYFGWLGRIFGKPRSAPYCWCLMGMKGLWIGLPIFPFGLALAFLWPWSYYISFTRWRDSLPAEWISHGFLGTLIVIGIYYGT